MRKTKVRRHYRKGFPVRSHARKVKDSRKGIAARLRKGSKRKIKNIQNVPDRDVLYSVYNYASKIPEGIEIEYVGIIPPERRIEIRQKSGKKKRIYYTPRILMRRIYPSGITMETPIKIRRFF